MRLPALRLPAVSWPTFDWLDGVGGRRVLLYALYTGALFVVFLIVNFPHHVLVQRFLRSIDLREQGLQLDIADTRFAWWRGYELQHVRLGPTDPERPPFVELGSLFVRPGLDGLLRGQVNSASLTGLLYGGEIDATVATADGVQRANLTFDGLQLQRYPLLADALQEGSVTGVLSGAVTIEHGAGAGQLHAAGEVNLEKASLTDAKISILSLPALHFDKTSLKFSVQGDRIDVQEFEASGPDLRLTLNGQIAVREPVYDSVLNLKFTAVPSSTTPEEVKNLLLLLPPPPKGAKPDTPHTLSGTLARPRVR